MASQGSSSSPQLPPLSSSQAIELKTLTKTVPPPSSNLEPSSPSSEPLKVDVETSPLPPTAEELPEDEEEHEEDEPIPKWPFLCLILQHLSSTWSERSYSFASYLYLIILFPTTLIPASLLGIVVTGAGLVGSGWVGGLIDERERLGFVRWGIGVQKALVSVSYAAFIVLFLPLRSATSSAWSSAPTSLSQSSTPATPTEHALVYICLAIIIVASSGAGLASGGLNVAIQRDWVVTISKSSSKNLTTLNTYLRRVDLIAALVSPLFISLLTTTLSYSISLYINLSITVFTLFVELFWIGVVWRAFPVLGVEESGRIAARRMRSEELEQREESQGKRTAGERWEAWKEGWRQMKRDWIEFIRLPVFLTSLSIALVYLTTLSFDGIMLSYLKSQRDFGDPFIAGMRGVSVVMGLLGTVVMPLLAKHVGLVRGGAWSLWAQIACLFPPLLTLYIGLPHTAPPGQGPVWNIVLFFTFISLSRIALWSIDLIQLQILQEALRDHPRRNRLTSLQLSLQSAFDLSKYAIVLGFNKPAEFKWTALISFIAVFFAGITYTIYLFQNRGHIHHWSFLVGGKPHEHDEHEHEHEHQASGSGRGKRLGERLGLKKRLAETVVGVVGTGTTDRVGVR
ncbi:hypothetical protein BDY24DRAFT_439796 [Mrakia frigida]|uniref:uncharacterized protein n=1 Tax=Mrakia frigida TaxID=29902 RepID=UPI003FCC1112